MESVYIQSKYIAQIWVHGSSLKSSTVAVVVPDEPSVKFWADGRGLPSGSLSVLCNNKELKVDNTFPLAGNIRTKIKVKCQMFIMEELRALSQTYQLSLYEKVRVQFKRCFKFPVEHFRLDLSTSTQICSLLKTVS